jgi:hypothetical protein
LGPSANLRPSPPTSGPNSPHRSTQHSHQNHQRMSRTISSTGSNSSLNASSSRLSLGPSNRSYSVQPQYPSMHHQNCVSSPHSQQRLRSPARNSLSGASMGSRSNTSTKSRDSINKASNTIAVEGMDPDAMQKMVVWYPFICWSMSLEDNLQCCFTCITTN